ncbi:GNAT family N-acetyltransferase [Allocoprobacillus halotolerans]|uniref:GNAT family N-acetyltransferase n=1 Tax=Allocoprobacillus halotolerans TaxID=2944914 RepID=A0ABY5I932_9FIRM|nr:GNAT family protein [Allocoprobacillus halotolerans]UTY40440.1 GNAT family N-acetyltransferase [Allocoprobacillus halotolerans]
MSCIIRKWKREDAKELCYCINDLRVLNNMTDRIPYPYHIEDAYVYIDDVLASDETKLFAFAIEYKGHITGSIAVIRQDDINRRSRKIGYYLGHDYWGQGIMSEAVKQIFQYVFKHSDIERIFAAPFDYNPASCRVLEKCGFEKEGILRKNGFKNGEFHDMIMYSLIK